MTYDEHAKEAVRLKGRVTRAKTAALKASTLAEKLKAKKAVKAAEAALQNHKLFFFDLVSS